MPVYNQLIYSFLKISQSVVSPTQHFAISSELIVNQTVKINPQLVDAFNKLNIVQTVARSLGNRELSVGNTLIVSQNFSAPKNVRSVLSFSYNITVEKAKWLKSTLLLNQTLVLYRTKRLLPSKLIVRQTVLMYGTRNKVIVSTLVIRQSADIYIRKVNKPKKILNPC